MSPLNKIMFILGLASVSANLLAQSGVEIEFMPRTPNQMSAFYEARGFPTAMIDLLSKQCFITIRIHNTGQQTLWLDLDNWQFSTSGKPLERFHRNHWKPVWADMAIPLAKQSTFRWTLLPEQLDYQPDEQEGGNIILPRVNTHIKLEARFASGADQQGPVITYRNDKLQCAYDLPE
jgi:hypothetical protein